MKFNTLIPELMVSDIEATKNFIKMYLASE